jgi:hypothetical protein
MKHQRQISTTKTYPEQTATNMYRKNAALKLTA